MKKLGEINNKEDFFELSELFLFPGKKLMKKINTYQEFLNTNLEV